jgi:tetratricopeptide (TPR) repeat protein
MIRMIAIVCIGMAAALFCAGQETISDTYPIIVMGTVTMQDGSPPPFSVGIERICSDLKGDTPGPITNKKGEWVWRMEFSALDSRSCVFQATHPGYTSSRLDASNLNLNLHETTVKLPPLILSGAVLDPYTIHVASDNMPAHTKGPFEKAMKDLDAKKYEDAITQLKAVVATAPKFGEGWHALGVVYDNLHHAAEAKDAYTHAVDVNPKLVVAWVTLARLCIRTKDWQCALNATDGEIKADSKPLYPETYIHRAVAQYELKDLAGAETSAQDAIRLDPKHKKPRAEYVLGRILEAKGDMNGAREHMAKYLDLEPTSADAEQVQARMLALGKAGAAAPEPELEPL